MESMEAKIKRIDRTARKMGWNLAKNAAGVLVLELVEEVADGRLDLQDFYQQFKARFPATLEEYLAEKKGVEGT